MAFKTPEMNLVKMTYASAHEPRALGADDGRVLLDGEKSI